MTSNTWHISNDPKNVFQLYWDDLLSAVNQYEKVYRLI